MQAGLSISEIVLIVLQQLLKGCSCCDPRFSGFLYFVLYGLLHESLLRNPGYFWPLFTRSLVFCLLFVFNLYWRVEIIFQKKIKNNLILDSFSVGFFFYKYESFFHLHLEFLKIRIYYYLCTYKSRNILSTDIKSHILLLASIFLFIQLLKDWSFYLFVCLCYITFNEFQLKKNPPIEMI